MGCQAFRMVSTSGVQCGSCLEHGVKEIWYRSDNDATCTKCFQEAEYDRQLHVQLQKHWEELKK